MSSGNPFLLPGKMIENRVVNIELFLEVVFIVLLLCWPFFLAGLLYADIKSVIKASFLLQWIHIGKLCSYIGGGSYDPE